MPMIAAAAAGGAAGPAAGGIVHKAGERCVDRTEYYASNRYVSPQNPRSYAGVFLGVSCVVRVWRA
jgi:hypothetical protein